MNDNYCNAGVALCATMYSIMQTSVHGSSRANVTHIKAYRTRIDPFSLAIRQLADAYYAVSSTDAHDIDI